MNHSMECLKDAIDSIEEDTGEQTLEEQRKHLIESYKGIESSNRTITSSARYIDYFVHDILDYAVIKGT